MTEFYIRLTTCSACGEQLRVESLDRTALTDAALNLDSRPRCHYCTDCERLARLGVIEGAPTAPGRLDIN